MNSDPIALGEEQSAFLWSLEELSDLVSHSGSASETLTNIVNLIHRRFSTDVCSIYLLEPDRANLVLAATIGLRPDSVGRVRMRLTEGLVGMVAEQVRPVVVHDTSTHPRFKYFQDSGEDPYRTFLGVPVIDRSVLQGVIVLQTTEARIFGDADVRMLAAAGAQLAPIISEARAVGQFVAPVHQRLAAIARNLWWSWDDDSTSLFRDLDPVLWRACDHNPIALLQRTPVDQLELRASQLALHGRINYAYRRLQEYLRSKHTWGGRHASVLSAAPVAYFSAEFGLHESLPIYSGGLGILAGDHLKSASDLGIPLVGIGLFYDQGYFRQRLDRDGWQQEEYLDVDHRHAADRAGPGTDGVPVTVEIDTRTGPIWPASGGSRSVATRCCCSIPNVDGEQPRGSRADGAALRRRSPRPHPAGAAARRRRRARPARRWASHRVSAPERRAQRLRRLELIRRRMEDEGIGFDEALRRVAAQVVFTTHTPVPAGHDRFAARSDRGAPRTAARRARPVARRLHGPRPRRSAQPRRRVLHDGARPEALAARQRRLVAARPRLAGDVDDALSGAARGRRPDRPHHQRRARAHLAGAADAAVLRPPPRRRLGGAQQRTACGRRSTASTTASCGRRTRR